MTHCGASYLEAEVPEYVGEEPEVAIFRELREVETFFFSLIPAAVSEKPSEREDLLPLAERIGLAVPNSLSGFPIEWDTHARTAGDDSLEPSISIVRPGIPGALGLTVGCVRVGRRTKVCLECGWLYCRIVIKGTF